LAPRTEILLECSWPDSDDAERELIREYKARGECELNIAPGGILGGPGSRAFAGHRDDWFQLGRAIKQVRADILEINEATERLVGKMAARLGHQVMLDLDSLKAHLESTVRKTHPDWQDVTGMFYGPEKD
jgi:hypothetical protein